MGELSPLQEEFNESSPYDVELEASDTGGLTDLPPEDRSAWEGTDVPAPTTASEFESETGFNPWEGESVEDAPKNDANDVIRNSAGEKRAGVTVQESSSSSSSNGSNGPVTTTTSTSDVDDPVQKAVEFVQENKRLVGGAAAVIAAAKVLG